MDNERKSELAVLVDEMSNKPFLTKTDFNRIGHELNEIEISFSTILKDKRPDLFQKAVEVSKDNSKSYISIIADLQLIYMKDETLYEEHAIHNHYYQKLSEIRDSKDKNQENVLLECLNKKYTPLSNFGCGSPLYHAIIRVFENDEWRLSLLLKDKTSVFDIVNSIKTNIESIPFMVDIWYSLADFKTTVDYISSIDDSILDDEEILLGNTKPFIHFNHYSFFEAIFNR